ncbi:MAG: helix-turn-helix transcriptional regulator [Acidobacteria bacterium]|nr:helix-turn-helix transcriptional regulator [Acidobacteriota bacterium]
MTKRVGGTIRELREAQELGLRAAADRLEISPAYLSRIERGRERPSKPALVKRLATLLGGDPDLLFRLAASTDPDLAAFA